MYVLGLNHGHNTSACLLKDGEPVAAVQEERFNGEKYSWAFPEQSIQCCMQSAGIIAAEVEHVCLSWDRNIFAKKRLIQHQMEYYPWTSGYFHSCLWWGIYRHYYKVPKRLQQLGFRGNLHFLNHHVSHAASAFFASSFDEAAILVVDGEGEYSCTSTYRGNGIDIKPLSRIEVPHSIGYLYEVFSLFVGFDRFEGPGKVMGLAAMGDYRTYYDFFKGLVELKRDGAYTVDPCIYLYYVTKEERYLKKVYDALGKPSQKGNGESKRDRDVAAALQKITEDVLLHVAAHLHRETGSNNVVMAGGVALNSVANDRILKETPFRNIFIQPAADDSGTAIGAALYYHHSVLRRPRKYVMKDAFLGPQYGDQEVERVLKQQNVDYERPKDVAAETARLLAEGNVVAWFQGRMEWGPRALGSRSILADPRNNAIKEDLNKKVKRREEFRPFAPSVLEEKASEYFTLTTDSPYMLLVCDVHESKRGEIPAIVHVDGSARPQTVSRKTNPKYYHLIEEFYRRTGVPLILNTSFNIQEPIVCTPEQALTTFLSSKMDYLVIGNYIVSRNRNARAASATSSVERFPVERKHAVTRVLSTVMYFTVVGLFVYVGRSLRFLRINLFSR